MTIQLKLDEDALASIKKYQENDHTLVTISDLFDDSANGDFNSIFEELEGIYGDQIPDVGAGSHHVDELAIDDIEIDYNTGNGKLYISFVQNHFFGCSDYDNSVDKTDTINFRLNMETGDLFLDLYEPPSRDPDIF